jgi:hypothetical protein
MWKFVEFFVCSSATSEAHFYARKKEVAVEAYRRLCSTNTTAINTVQHIVYARSISTSISIGCYRRRFAHAASVGCPVDTSMASYGPS